MAIPASSAARMIASPSIMSVLPASTESSVGACGLHRLDRRDADDRDVEAHVLVRLRDLHDAGAGVPQAVRRATMTASVPSIASTATTARRFHRNRLPDIEAGQRRRRSGSRPRNPLARRRSALDASARLARARAARGTPSSPSARCRARASTSATPEMSASVFSRLQPHQHPEQRQVGHDVGEELRVLHLPGHHGPRDTCGLNRLTHVPS